jgi:hypothetical protein
MTVRALGAAGSCRVDALDAGFRAVACIPDRRAQPAQGTPMAAPGALVLGPPVLLPDAAWRGRP